MNALDHLVIAGKERSVPVVEEDKWGRSLRRMPPVWREIFEITCKVPKSTP